MPFIVWTTIVWMWSFVFLSYMKSIADIQVSYNCPISLTLFNLVSLQYDYVYEGFSLLNKNLNRPSITIHHERHSSRNLNKITFVKYTVGLLCIRSRTIHNTFIRFWNVLCGLRTAIKTWHLLPGNKYSSVWCCVVR